MLPYFMGLTVLAIFIFVRWNVLGLVGAGVAFVLAWGLSKWLISKDISAAQVAQLMKMLPYLISLAVLAGVTGRSPAPAALGKPYIRE